MQRSFGVILVCDRRAESRHDGIPDELLDRAARCFDFRAHGLVEPIEDGASPFGILHGSELARPDEISEEDGRDLALLGR